MTRQVTESLTFFQILASTFAAAIGVQSRAKMERDLTHGEILKFIAAGVSFTILFVVGMITLVSVVASN